MIICIRCALAEGYWIVDRRVRVGCQKGCGALIEEAGITKIIGQLPADFRAGQDRMSDLACVGAISEIGLIEDIPPLRGIVVCRKRHFALISRHEARHIILIKPVIIAEHRPIANAGSTGLMGNVRSAKIHVKSDTAVVRVPVKRGNIDVRRLALK